MLKYRSTRNHIQTTNKHQGAKYILNGTVFLPIYSFVFQFKFFFFLIYKQPAADQSLYITNLFYLFKKTIHKKSDSSVWKFFMKWPL